jgi:hypothetical protein
LFVAVLDSFSGATHKGLGRDCGAGRGAFLDADSVDQRTVGHCSSGGSVWYQLDTGSSEELGKCMRCLACNCDMTDFEATRKWLQSREFVDLCNRCFNSIKAECSLVEEREDLRIGEVLPDPVTIWEVDYDAE